MKAKAKTKTYYCKTKINYNDKTIKHGREGSYVVCPNCGKFIAIKMTGQTQRNVDC